MIKIGWFDILLFDISVHTSNIKLIYYHFLTFIFLYCILRSVLHISINVQTLSYQINHTHINPSMSFHLSLYVDCFVFLIEHKMIIQIILLINEFATNSQFSFKIHHTIILRQTFDLISVMNTIFSFDKS